MKATFAVFFALVLLQLAYSFEMNMTREEILANYQEKVGPKIPQSAKVLIGDERMNVYVAGRVFGVETKRGELYYFETYALNNPGVVVTVSDYAAEQISKKKMGITQAINSGGIRIEPKNFLSALKVEAAKRIYSASGGDDYLLGKKKTPAEKAGTYNAIYVSRTRIWN